MTGFGAGESVDSHWQVSAEISGVNRKQLDVAFGMPQTISAMESDIRKSIAAHVSRGRIHVRISIKSLADRASVLTVDTDLAQQYLDGARQIAEQTGLECNVTVADMMRSPGLFQLEDVELDLKDVQSTVEAAVEQALQRLVTMQSEEGQHLRDDLEKRLSTIEAEIAKVSANSRDVVDRYRESLHSRLSDCGLEIDLDDDRVLREIALYAEKSDISEEITRIASHVAQFRKYFASDEPIGRSLDFLCQELNRELNTIGSKCNHAVIAQSIVDSKTELEKVREQVQNVQ